MISRRYLICLATVACLLPTIAHGQSTTGGKPAVPSQPPPEPVLTIFTVPENAEVAIRGSSDLVGRTPIDVPPLMAGVHSIVVQGSGLSRTQGIIFIPPQGKLPFVISESPGVSWPLLLRGINYPGIPDFQAGRRGRGISLATGATFAGVMAVRAHLYYRDRLDEVGDYAADRAEDERYYRNSWVAYGAVVWGLSAVEYWIRPRIALVETTPTRLTLGVSKASRGGAMWRSILVPGAGQEYANHRTRAIVWLASVLGAGAGYVVADYRLRRDETDYKFAKINLDSAGPSEVALRQLQLEQASRSLDASKDIRHGFIVATATLYGLNLLDATIMYLRLVPPDKPRVSYIGPIMLPDGPGIALTLRL